MSYEKKNSGINRSRNIPVAKTIEEANSIAVRIGIAKEANFEGISVENANIVIKEIAEAKEKFGLDALDYVGNKEYSIVKDDVTDKHVAMFYATEHNDGSHEYGIVLNDEYFSTGGAEKHKADFIRAVERRFHPRGTGTSKGFVDHEIGHWIAYSAGDKITNDKLISGLYNRYHEVGNEKGYGLGRIRMKLSSYANVDKDEFIAEAWGEYKNNIYSRPLARRIARRMEKIYNESGT